MAHKKAGGSTALGRDSAGQRLGVKAADGQKVKSGAIIIRQRGTKFHPGLNVRRGNDDTLYAVKEGIVSFIQRKAPNFHGKLRKKRIVQVLTAKTKTKKKVEKKEIKTEDQKEKK